MSETKPHIRLGHSEHCGACGQKFDVKGKPSSLGHVIFRVHIRTKKGHAFISGKVCTLCLSALDERQVPERSEAVTHGKEGITGFRMAQALPSFPKVQKKYRAVIEEATA